MQSQSNAPLDIDTIRETNSMSNSITSFASGYTQTTIRNRRRGVIEIDPNAEILRTNIRVASCAILLLQEVRNSVAHSLSIDWVSGMNAENWWISILISFDLRLQTGSV